MLFYFFEFIINRIKKSFILNLWFIMGFKICKKQSMELCQQKAYCNKEWDLVLKLCAQFMSHFLLWYIYIQFKIIYIIYSNFSYSHQYRYTRYTLYLYFLIELQDKEEERNWWNKKKIQITKVMEAAWAMTIVLASNDDRFWISMRPLVFFEIIFYENQTFCLI